MVVLWVGDEVDVDRGLTVLALVDREPELTDLVLEGANPLLPL